MKYTLLIKIKIYLLSMLCICVILQTGSYAKYTLLILYLVWILICKKV